MEMQNKIIESKVNLGPVKVKIKVESFLKNNPEFKNGYVYFDCPDVSDLFVVENSALRPCTDSEWSKFFKIYLYPPKIVKEPAFHVKRLLSW